MPFLDKIVKFHYFDLLIHKLHVIHFRLKPSNILLDDKLEAKITDFDFHFLRKTEDLLPLPISIKNALILPPEYLTDEIYDFSSDVYSYSMILYFMFSTEIVCESKKIKSSAQLMKLIHKGRRLERPDNIPDYYWNLINKCWDQDPSKRPTFEEIVEILKDDKFALNEFGMNTNLDELHEYQNRIDN